MSKLMAPYGQQSYQKRLLTNLLLVFVFTGLLGAVFGPAQVRFPLSIVSLLYLFDYILSKSRYHQFSGWSSVLAGILVSINAFISLPQASISTETIFFSLSWLVIPIIFSSLWFSILETSITTLVIFLLVLFIYLGIYQLPINMLIPTIGFIITSFTLIMVAMYIRTQNQSEIIQRTDQLRRESARAEKASQAKSEFLTNMSHELRTPLNAIIGYSELIEDDLANLAAPQQVLDDLNRVQYSSQHLLSLINNLLDISKIEAQKMTVDISHIDLETLIEEVVMTTKSLALSNSNEFLIENRLNDFQLRSDGQKIKQILINLLSNAFKFTENAQVSLTISLTNIDGADRVDFCVNDRGEGIEPEFVEKLFEPFLQSNNSSTRKHQGSGLGLAISKQFAVMLGGDIYVESVLNKGSRFTLSIPQFEVALSGKHLSYQESDPS